MSERNEYIIRRAGETVLEIIDPFIPGEIGMCLIVFVENDPGAYITGNADQIETLKAIKEVAEERLELLRKVN